MSDTNNINNDLDQYGVWVKNTSQESSIDDSLPDFSFLENSETQGEALDNFESDDTALSADELLNITSGMSITEEAPVNEEISLDQFESDVSETESPSSETEEISLDSFITDGAEEEISVPDTDDLPDGEISLDEFMSPESEPAAEPKTEEVSEMPDGEISLDEFMDIGSSDASANDNFMPDGEISLDAFLDTGSSAPAHDNGEINLEDFMGPSAAVSRPEEKVEEIVDEKPMDIDLSFEEGMEVLDEQQSDSEEESFDTVQIENASGETEEIDLSSFDTSFGDETPHDFAPEMHTADSTEVSIDSFGSSEEVDLSSFGIEEDSGNQNIVMPGSGGHDRKKASVDYEMNVTIEDEAESEDDDEIVEESNTGLEEEIVLMEPAAESAKSNDAFNLDSFVPDTQDEITESSESAEAPVEETADISDEIAVEDFSFDSPVTEEEAAAEESFVFEETAPAAEENPVEEETVTFEEPAPSLEEEFEITEDIPSTKEVISEEEAVQEQEIDIPVEDFAIENPVEEPVVQEEIQPEVIEDLNAPVINTFNDEPPVEEIIEEKTDEIEPEEYISESFANEINIDTSIPAEENVSESSYSMNDSIDDNIFEGVSETLPEEIEITEEPAEEINEESIVSPEVNEPIEEETVVFENKEDIMEPEVEQPEAKETVSLADEESLDILKKISDELSSLRMEINGLKTEFESLKNISPASSIIEEPTVIEEHPEEQSNTGFFADSDGDDTIAISTAELDDLLSEEEEQDTGFFADSDGDDTIALSGSELDNILNNAEFSTEEQPVEETVTEEIENITEESFVTEEESPINFEENLEEPVIEENTEYIPEDIPENDEIVVESDDTGSMDIQVSTEPAPSLSNPIDLFADEASPITDNSIQYLAEEESPVEETVENGISEEPVNDVFDNWEEPKVEEIDDKPFIPAEESSLEEIEKPFEEDDKPAEVEINNEPKSDNIPVDMKEEIKSVLSYMDQLLENLPEDKITEFAQSDEFEIYKKLFIELGLA